MGHDPRGQETPFRTLEAITVAPGMLQAVQRKDERVLHDFTAHWLKGESLGLFGAVPQLGAELYLGFSHAWPVAESVNLYFTFVGPRTGEDERRRLIEETNARKHACRPLFTDFPCPQETPLPVSAAELEELPPHRGVRLVWEALTTVGGRTDWRVLGSDEVEDGTRAFTLDGRVRLRLPAEMAKKSLGAVTAELYYLRIRFEAGAYDAPPMLRTLSLNGVAAEQATPVGTGHIINGQGTEAVVLGVGTGFPHQALALPLAPVQESSCQILTCEGNKWLTWRLRPDFDSSTRRDSDFQLDPTTGAVTFGDGEHGRVPPLGAPIFAVYRATRAEAGNVAAGTVNRLSDSSHNRAALGNDFERVKAGLTAITNPVAATGGAAAESLAHAIGRAIELMETPQRAVTLKDYETLAMQTPGVRLARVTARANLHPSFPCLKASGMITLIILPDMPTLRPAPSPALRRTVAAYLNRRRVIGTRVEVVGPTYLEVTVRARVRGLTGINKIDLQQKIVAALNEFLHPLHGGPERKGWPFGRDVYRAEILQVIDEVAGVDHVLSLELIAAGCEPQCGNVCLAPTWLAAAGPHEIEVV
jgi:predicted phage baseplate assembly protein